MKTDIAYNLCDDYAAKSAKQLDIISYALEEMSVLARSTEFFWESEEREVFTEAFLDFKDEAERLLSKLKNSKTNTQTNEKEIFLESDAIY